MEKDNKKINFEELAQEYKNTITGVNIEELENGNKVLDSDIELRKREVNNLEKRLNDLENILNSVDSKDYVQRRQTTDDLVKVSELKDKKEKEMKELTEKRDEQQNKIDKVKNAEENTLNKAEEKVNARKAAIEKEIKDKKKETSKEIKKLKERKEKYGKNIETEDGKVKKQLTSEERIAIEKIDAEIAKLESSRDEKVKGLEQEIEANDKELKKFKIRLKQIKLGRDEKSETVKEENNKTEIKKDNEEAKVENKGESKKENKEESKEKKNDENEQVKDNEKQNRADNPFYVPTDIDNEPVIDDNSQIIDDNQVIDDNNQIIGDNQVIGDEDSQIIDDEQIIDNDDEKKITAVKVLKSKYVVTFEDGEEKEYPVVKKSKRLKDLAVSRKNEKEDKEYLADVYPEYEEIINKKMDPRLGKLFLDNDLDLFEIYAESLKNGEKEEGLPEITYNLGLERGFGRMATAGRIAARNHSDIAKVIGVSKLNTVYDAIISGKDKAVNWMSDKLKVLKDKIMVREDEDEFEYEDNIEFDDNQYDDIEVVKDSTKQIDNVEIEMTEHQKFASELYNQEAAERSNKGVTDVELEELNVPEWLKGKVDIENDEMTK